MLPLGTKAPDFTLFDTISQKPLTLSQQPAAKATVIMFICNHCPYVKHILLTLTGTADRYRHKGVKFYAISSNDAEQYVADSPENMYKTAGHHDFSFPYLYDETQAVAKAYDAACTPDIYLFDADLKLVYRGRFDAATPGNDIPVTGEELCQAMDAVLTGHPVSPNQHPSMGCNIKWKES